MMHIAAVVSASAGSRVRPWRGRGKKKTKTAADKERLTVSLGIASGRRRSAANVLAVLAVLLRIRSSLCSIDLRLVKHDGRLALELLSHDLNCRLRCLGMTVGCLVDELIEGSNNLNAAVSRKVAKYGLVVED
jgi:hypothetical protein